VRAVNRANLDLVGIALDGPRSAVDKIVKGASMHPKLPVFVPFPLEVDARGNGPQLRDLCF
jgi:hypothetical protein